MNNRQMTVVSHALAVHCNRVICEVTATARLSAISMRYISITQYQTSTGVWHSGSAHALHSK